MASQHALAAVLGKAVLYLPMGLVSAVLPTVAATHAQQFDGRRQAWQAMLATLGLAGFAAVACAVLGPWFVNLLYGEKHGNAGRLLGFYGFAMVPMGVALVGQAYVVGKGRPTFSWVILIFAVVELAIMCVWHPSIEAFIATIAAPHTGLAVVRVALVAIAANVPNNQEGGALNLTMSIFRRFVHNLESALPRPLFLAIYGCFANLKNIRNLLIGYGQWRTCFTHRPTDRRGNPIPWFTYPALEYLEGIDLTEMSVFEFGCGNSTRYWSKRARSVVAIEDNPSWADEIRGKIRENASIVSVQSPADYAAAIALNRESYDLIIIDGTDRLGCARAIDGRLRDGGFVILDDADEHVEAAAVLRAYNLIEVDFAGFGPIASYSKTTSFFFHPSFRPIPRKSQLPLHSVCHPFYVSAADQESATN